ncbi:hypothetical protein FA13DRAFT_1739877, partial [Coprinellus micaceus]
LLRRTVTLITTLRTRPHLKLHIRTLRCKVLLPIRSGIGDSTVINISKSIADMVNIRKFVLGFDAGTNPSSINFGVTAPGVLRGAIASLLQRPQLIEYTLHSVCFYPQSMLRLSKSVRHLRILHSTIDGEDYDEAKGAHAIKRLESPCMTRISCETTGFLPCSGPSN